VAVALAALGTTALAAVHFQKETLKAYEHQLARHEVHADSFHPASPTASGHLHVSLNDGRHMTVGYAASEQSRLLAQAQAKGARVLVASAKAKTVKPVKHKLRYYAGGALIVVILIVVGVLIVGRRRTIMEQAQQTGASAEGPPVPQPSAPTDAE
jgi:hypothetical protein